MIRNHVAILITDMVDVLDCTEQKLRWKFCDGDDWKTRSGLNGQNANWQLLPICANWWMNESRDISWLTREWKLWKGTILLTWMFKEIKLRTALWRVLRVNVLVGQAWALEWKAYDPSCVSTQDCTVVITDWTDLKYRGSAHWWSAGNMSSEKFINYWLTVHWCENIQFKWTLKPTF